MTTTTVPIQITCPDWCTINADEHVRDLWNSGGNCFHHADDVLVEDTGGYQVALEETRHYPPVSLGLTVTTNPEGRETASPVFRVDEQEHSLEQALAIAEAIHRMVATYRAEEFGMSALADRLDLS
jgi:hypothetical protein